MGLSPETSAAQPPLHEVEDIFRAASLYGIDGVPPAACVVAAKVHDPSTVAIHISVRKPSQRWPAERFVDLMRELHKRDPSLRFVLLWSPGAADDPRHPGDDGKAARIVAALGERFPLTPAATAALPALITALAQCGVMICADGGAIHLGAGLGLPIVALFGDSSVARWRPWAVPQQVLQAPSRYVADISVAEVVAAFSALQAGVTPGLDPGPAPWARSDTRAPTA